MTTYHHLGEIPGRLPKAHLALGVFDGLHKGHQRVIQGALDRARLEGGQAGVYTFPNHPMDVIDPTNCPPLLTTPVQKEGLLSGLGLDFLILESFTEQLRALSAAEFLERILDKLDLTSVSVGEDFRFGRGRSGSLATLREMGAARGFEVLVAPEERFAGVPLSSTIVRECVRHGDVHLALPILGRPYEVSGLVVEGDGVGRKLGFPTANVLTENEIWPKRGVYVVRAGCQGELQPAVANIGRAPTRRSQAESRLEVHLLSGGGNFYGQRMAVQFLTRLREEMKFDGLEALKMAISEDVAQANHFFAREDSAR